MSDTWYMNVNGKYYCDFKGAEASTFISAEGMGMFVMHSSMISRILHQGSHLFSLPKFSEFSSISAISLDFFPGLNTQIMSIYYMYFKLGYDIKFKLYGITEMY